MCAGDDSVANQVLRDVRNDKSAIQHVISHTDERGQTPLHQAVVLGLVKTFDTLLELGADLNVQDHQGQTALHKAYWSQNPHFIKTLLQKGARVDTEDNYNNLPIFLLAYTPDRKVAICKKEIRGDSTIYSYIGCSDNMQRYITTYELIPIEHEVKKRIQDGSAAGSGSCSNLEQGFVEYYKNLIKISLRQHPNILNQKNSKGDTLLHKVVDNKGHLSWANQKALLSELIDQGAGIDTKDQEGYPPLFRAIEQDDCRVVNFLVAKGANCTIEVDKESVKRDALGLAQDLEKTSHGGYRRIVQFLKNHCKAGQTTEEAKGGVSKLYQYTNSLGERVRIYDNELPSSFASRFGIILQKGDYKDARSTNAPICGIQYDSVQYAIVSAYAEQIKSLVQHGFDINAKGPKQRTVLHTIASLKEDEISWIAQRAKIDVLWCNGAEIHARDEEGNTPLHLAIQAVNKNLVKLFLTPDYKADLNVQNNQKQIPLKLAQALRSSVQEKQKSDLEAIITMLMNP